MFEVITIAGMLAWCMIEIAVVLYDVYRHPPVPIPQPAPATGMTTQGVPYVFGSLLIDRQEVSPDGQAQGKPGMLTAAVHAA